MDVTRSQPGLPRRTRIMLAIGLLSLAALGTAVLAPLLFRSTGGSGRPGYVVLAGTGAVLILLTTAFLSFAGRVLGLGTAWVVSSLICNVAVVMIKFVLVPIALYRTTFTLGILSIDPNNGSFALLAGAATFALYAIAALVIYAIERSRVRDAIRLKNGPPAPAPPPSRRRYAAITAAFVVGGCLASPLAIALAWVGLTYWSAIFATGSAVTLAIVIAIGTGAYGFRLAGNRSAEVADLGVLATVFWCAFCLLLIYHLVWIVFMTVMINLWPLTTVSPSGK